MFSRLIRALLIACCLFPVAHAADSPQPVEAVWKAQEVTFFFQSFRTFYSCDSLEGKLAQILKELGATARVRVSAANCAGGVVTSPRATIQVISPVPATADAIAELKEDQPTRELIARVRGESEVATEFIKPFPAQWQRVEIGGRGDQYLQAGDCELIDQVRRWLLPKLNVRVIEENAPCPTGSPSFGAPSLVVEALVRMPDPDEAPAAKPVG